MTATADSDPSARDLEALLEQLATMVDGQARLLEAIQRQREAIRRADLDALAAVCREEERLVARLDATNSSRLQLMERVTRHLAPGQRRTLGIDEIAGLAPARLRAAIEELGRRLRAARDEIRRESAIVRDASEALARHLGGILQSVHASVTRSSVYGRRGRIMAPSEGDCCVDLKT